MSQSILVTGASSSLANLTAHTLARAGHTVSASMRDTAGRNASRMAEAWAEEASIDLCTADLDVVSQDSADTAVRQIVTECGRLHLVAHNAGPLTVGPTAAFSTEKIAGCSTPTCSVPTGSTGVPRHRVGGAQRQGALRSWQSKANHYTTHLGRSGQL